MAGRRCRWARLLLRMRYDRTDPIRNTTDDGCSDYCEPFSYLIRGFDDVKSIMARLELSITL